MWKPTAGKVKGKYFVQGGLLSSGYGVLVCVSHTGKMFEVDVPWGQAVGTDIGQSIFCNGEFCRRMESYEHAIERLNEVSAGEPRTNTAGEERTTSTVHYITNSNQSLK